MTSKVFFLRSTFLLVAVPATSWAIVPNNQFSLVNEVVRVEGDNGLGSGNVIHKSFDARTGNMFICVLTADHVTRANPNLKFGYGNSGAGGSFELGLGTGLSSYAVFNSANFFNADISLFNINVSYNTLTAAQQASLNALNPFSLAAAPAAPGFTGTVRGFGLTGIEIQNHLGEVVGYRHRVGVAADGFGTRRFLDNQFDTYQNYAAGIYNYDAMFMDLDQPGHPTRVANEGLTFQGDSGGGYFFGGNLIGVHTSGETRSIYDNLGNLVARDVYYGFRAWGVKLTPRLIHEIEVHCVPEPGSLAVLGLGMAALLRRRRRHSA